MVLYRLARPLLFRLDAERAHGHGMGLLTRVGASRRARGAAERRFAVRHPALAQQVWGLTFPAPLGLAAGFDKNALAPLAWQALGFGFVEFGTVTPRPQPGNPRPRLWRDPGHQGLVNAMGFNNDGAPAIAERLVHAKGQAGIPWAVNIGKQRETPLERAAEDYLSCLNAVAGVADLVVVNVSSPNTPGLREMQKPENLRALLAPLADRARALRQPLLVKLDPDLAEGDLDAAVGVALDLRLDGIVCTNTSLSLPRPEGVTLGGVSGAPLRARSTEVLRRVAQRAQGQMPLVGVGGVFTAEDAYAKVRAGASLVEAYTGFVYQGPAMAREVHRGLLRLLERDGLRRIGDAVGADLKER